MNRQGRKRPWLAVVLSLVLPGPGQFYNGQPSKAVPLAVLWIVVNFLSSSYEPFNAFIESESPPTFEGVPGSTLVIILGYSVAIIFILGISIYDAYKTAARINHNLNAEQNQP